MKKLYEKAEHFQNDKTVNASLNNQRLQGDSFFDVSHDQDLKCELQQWDIKQDIYLQVKQEVTPDLDVQSELPASTQNISQNDYHCQDQKAIDSTQHPENEEEISMTFSKDNNGL